MYQYRAKVNKVIDGDTVELVVDLGFSISIVQRVRLYGVDTPELHSKDPEERTRARAAVAYLLSILPPFGEWLTVETIKDNTDKYGRLLAKLVLADGKIVNHLLIGGNYGAEYFGGKRG